MTIQQIVERTKKTAPEFFSEKNLAFFGQTLDSFTVNQTILDWLDFSYWRVSAPIIDSRGRRMGETFFVFSEENDEIIDLEEYNERINQHNREYVAEVKSDIRERAVQLLRDSEEEVLDLFFSKLHEAVDEALEEDGTNFDHHGFSSSQVREDIISDINQDCVIDMRP